jgi:cysteine desulfurase/selenocysteine lyase
VVFTRGTTESINLVARSFVRPRLAPGDEVVVTWMEHHANIVPWQIVCGEAGAALRPVAIDERGALDLAALEAALDRGGERVRMVALAHISNALGTVNPVREVVATAHARGVPVLVDGAQAVPHMPVDVQAWDSDFMAFSGHKMCGPTGSGILHGKRHLLEAMPPFMGGGDMIRRVTLQGSTWNELPYKFEAGTPSIAEGIGLGTAVDYLTDLGMENVHAHEQYITNYALEALSEVENLQILGPSAAQRGGVASFTIEGLHPHDMAELLDKDGIAIRAGHHCAMPLHHELGINSSARASFYIHTTTEEVDKLVDSLNRAKKIFRL